MARLAATLALMLLPALAGASPPWPADARFDPAVPPPSAFLGHEVGERHAEVDALLSWCEALAASSDRVELERIGTSVEGDPLLLLSITDPSRRLPLEQRQAAMAVVMDPWSHDEDTRRDAAARLRPATWIACSVHGDEASGTDAGIALAYWLAAGQGAEVERVLRETTVLVDPCQNPDGRRRFLQHVRAFGRRGLPPDADPAAVEHHQLWPGGRRNHYLFDLNRDWAFLTQAESRARAAAYLRWRPQVLADLHEMQRESSYYFPPPAEPVNPFVPDLLHGWWERFGRANARAFDAAGYDFFVRETFDLFYPGYGDSWPTLQGAVGMTFEQATTRGRALRRDGEGVLLYAEAVRRHFTAAWRSCLTAAEHAAELMASQVEFFGQARAMAEADDRRAIVLDASVAPARAARLAALLVAQGIDVERTTGDGSARLRPRVGGDERRVTLPAGSFIVPLRQPLHGLLRALLDLGVEMDPGFLAEEGRRLEQGLDSRIYDVSAWGLVELFGVRAWHSGRALELPARPVVPGGLPSGELVGDGAAVVAWAIPYLDNEAPRAAATLLAGGFTPWATTLPFTQAGREFPVGSFVLRPGDDPGRLRAALQELVSTHAVQVVALPGGWTERGPSLGSSRIFPLRAPRIALLTGPGTQPGSSGAWRWLLEERYGLAHSAILASTLDDMDLHEIDVLVLPSLRKDATLPTERLDAWVREGGTVVAVAGAVDWLLDTDLGWIGASRVRDLRELAGEGGKLEGEGLPPLPETEDDDDATAEVPRPFRPRRVPGAILRVEVDAHSPLRAGLSDAPVAPLNSDRLLQVDEGARPLVRYATTLPRLAGYMPPPMERAAAGMAFAGHDRPGRGNVLWFAEDPAFRGSWEALHPLLLNAILLAPSMPR